MAKNYPPYMNATRLIDRILKKIKEAATPDRFTQDYLSTELNFPGGSARAFIPLAKRTGLLASDGTPTELYKQFRNQETSGVAMATAIKNGYADLYTRNENAHSLDKQKLEGLIIEITGMEKSNRTLVAIVGTFEALKAHANFKLNPEKMGSKPTSESIYPDKNRTEIDHHKEEDFNLNLSYTINLVLPKTDDIAVFNAIFRSLRDNLMKK